MKKVVLTAVTVVFAAIAAQAQSAGVEVRLADRSMRGAFVRETPKRTTPTVRSDSTKTTQLGRALERRVIQQVKQKADSTRVNQPAGRTQQMKPTAQCKAKQWIKAVLLNGRFPGESAEVYHNRLAAQYYAAAQPFK